MALDPYGNQLAGPRNADEYGNMLTNVNGGNISGGAAANYGGGQAAYNNEVNRQQGNANDYRSMAAGSYGLSGQARGQQQDALGMMRQAALGNAPSVAAIQQKQGMESALRGQQAMAAGARGSAGLAGAQYNAAMNAGALQQSAVGQASQLRAGEMAQARDAYGNMTNSIRGQDIGQAGQQGQLGLGYENVLQNTQLGQMHGQQAAASLAEKSWEAQMAADEASARNQESMIGGIAGKAGSAIASIFSDVRMKSNIVPEGLPPNPYTGDEPLPNMTRDLGNPSDPNSHTSDWRLSDRPRHEAIDAYKKKLGAAIEGAKKDDAHETAGDKFGNGLAGSLQGFGKLFSDEGLKSGISPTSKGWDNGYEAGNKYDKFYPGTATYDAGATSTAKPQMYTSDERQKTGLDPRHAEPAEMMEHLQPYSYDYKPGRGLPPGRQYGIMAQDLEKTPMGASVVEDTPRGKAIDASRATGLHFAAEANLHQRLRALEAQRGR